MKTQFVRGSKTLGLFVIGSVLLAQLFVGGAVSIASAETEVTPDVPSEVLAVTPTFDVLPAAPEVAPQIVEETPPPADVTPEPTPAPLPEVSNTTDALPSSDATPVDSTTDAVVPTATSTQDSSSTETIVEPAPAPAPETLVAAVSVPELTTDKDDYHPGETATIFGRFFGALQHVVLKIFGSDENNGAYTEETQNITTDEQGSFVTTYLLDNIYRPIYNLIVSDDQGTELATGSFTDAASGPNTGTVVNDNSAGSIGWTNSANASGSNNVYATAVVTAGNTTNYLRATGFGFAIPAGAIIDGIQVQIEKKQACTGSGCTSNVTDTTVRLVKAGVITGSNYADTSTPWGTSDATSTYGTGTTDKWGTTWTLADINASNFGVVINAQRSNGGDRTLSVDAITIIVNYTLPIPDLSISKTNTVGGVAGVGSTFNWQLAVSNIGSTSTTFTNGQTIVTDQLPNTNISYTGVSTSTTGVTGTMNCSIVSSNLSCVAVGNVTMSVGATTTITISASPSAAGTFTNPRASGVCTVATVSGETNTVNNACTSNAVTVSVLPDLIVTKSNDLGSAEAIVGTSFHWVLDVANIGAATSTFAPGFSVLRDSLPATSTATYGAPTVTLQNGTTGTLNCSVLVSNNTLECTTGGSFVIPPDGIITVSLPVTPLVIGTLNNPRASGVCLVDPTGIISETSTINNGCADNVVVIDTTFPTVVSINRASTTPTNTVNAVWSVVFSEAVTGVNAADFTLANSGLTSAITTVTGTGTTYTVTASSSGQGTLGLNLIDDDSIKDLAGNTLSGAGAGNGDFTGQVYTIDRIAPTVTVNQAVTQIDPTNVASVVFTVAFSEPVTGFATNDITVGGTAGGAKTVSIATTSATTFDVTVTWTPTTAGTVIASLAASRVTDAVGNANSASTATDNSVQYNLPTFNITSSASVGGTITPNGVTPVSLGGTQAYNSVPSAGNILNSVVVNGVTQLTRLQTFTFTGVTTTHNIIANFDSGWNAPTNSPSSAGILTAASGAFTSNDTRTQFDNGGDVADYNTFNVVIPPGATINGIQVAMEGFRDAGSTRTFDVSLSSNNGTSFTAVKNASAWNQADQTLIVGGTADLWGRTWAVGDFTNANFRLKITSSSGGNTIHLDHIQVKVSYTADTIAPTLAEVTPVPALTNDNTPNYTFSSTEAGTIVYGGDCSSGSTSAVAGNNTKTFSTLLDGLHNNCTVSVVDLAGNTSTPLSVSAFTVDTQAPVITILGNNPETVSFGASYVDAGATVNDDSTVVTTGSVNTGVVGSYTLFYNATDAAGNPAVQVSRLVNVAPASQTITFGALADKTYGDADFTVSATSDSGLSVNFISSGDCSVTGSTVTLLGAGSCTITARQAGNTNYTAAPDVLRVFSIAQAPSVTVVTCPSSVVYDGAAQTPCTATVTGFGGLNQSVSVVHTNNTDVGIANASATFAGDADHAGSNNATTFDITLAPSTTSVTCTSSEVYTGSPITPCTVSVTGAGGLSLTPAPVYADNTNVGTASASYTFLGDTNHSGSTDSKNFTITAKPITVTADPQTKVFGSADPAVTYVSSDVAPFVGALDRAPGENVGTYAIGQGTLTAGANYSITFNSADLTITKADALVSVSGFSGTYDGNAHGASGSATGVNAEDLSASLNLGASFTDVPGGTANWTFTGGQNYNDQSGSVSVTITKATPTIVVTPYAVTYDGNPHTTVGSATGVSSEPLAGLDLSLTTHTDAGTYPTDAWTFIDVTGNYTNQNGTVSSVIAKADATIVVSPYAVLYDGAPHTALGTATGVSAEVLSGLLDLSSTVHTNVGSYVGDVWSFAGNTNYNSTNGTVDNSISAIPASVTPNAQTKVYGISDPVLTGTLSGFLLGDGVTATYARTSGENVGSYAISATLAPAPVLANYDITYNTANLDITQAPITVTADTQTKVYGEADPALTYQVTSGALVVPDSITGSLLRDAGENVGEYVIHEGSMTAGGNYSVTYVPANLSITKKSASVTANDKSKIYGDTNPAFDATVVGTVGVETLNYTLSTLADASSPVGTYPIAVTPGLNPNYDVVTTNGTLTVEKKIASVTPDANTKVYGDTDPVLTGTLFGFLPVDSVTATYSRIAGESVSGSPYTISATLSPLGVLGNYDITYGTAEFTITSSGQIINFGALAAKTYGDADFSVTATADSGLTVDFTVTGNCTAAGNTVHITGAGSCTVTAHQTGDTNFTPATDVSHTFAIGKATVSVSADNKTKTYGAADPAFTVTYGTFVNGENESVIDTSPTASISGAHDNVGAYDIVLSGGSDNNYEFSFTSGTLTIESKPITVTADVQSKVFGAPDPVLTYINDPLVGTDTFTGALSRASGEDVGVYAIGQGTLTAGTNYALTFVPSDLSITQAPSQTLVTCPPSATYTGLALTPCTISVAGANLSLSPAPDYASNTDVGVATASYTFPGDTNHTGSTGTANFTIAPKTLTVTATPGQSKVYGDTEPTLMYTPSEVVLFTGALSRVAGENVGTYAITEGDLDAGTNYAITFVPANFAVTAKDINVSVNAEQNKVFGGVDPVLTYTADALIAPDTFSGTLARAVGEDVGTYAIGQGTLALSTNYTLHFTAGSFAITTKGITVTADAKSKVYGDADPALTFVSSDVGVSFTGTLTRTAGETVGAYAIGQGTLGAGDNYAVTFVPANLTISKAPSLTNITCPALQVYTGSPITPCTAAVTGVNLSTTASVTYDDNTNIGTATAHASYPGDVNHNGSTASDATFTIVDTEAPVITVSGIDPETVEVHGAYVDAGATASDNHDGSVTVLTTGTVDVHVVGSYTLHYNATDSSGNHAIEKTRVVHVVDTTNPVIAPHADVIAEATNTSGAVVSYVTPTSTDNVDGVVPVTCAPVSGSLFAFGTTTVLCDAQDTAGNHAIQSSFKVIVRDTVKPVIAAHADVNTATTSTAAIVTYTTPVATDSVDGSVAVSCLPASGGNFLVGSTTVTCSATDAHGNAAIPTTFMVNVTQVAPVISLESPAGVSTSTVTVTWTTDHPATSRVVFDTVSHPVAGVQPNYGYASSTVENPVLVTNHSVSITGLTPATTYYFRTVSHGSPEAVSSQIATTTLPLPVVVPTKGAIIVTKNTVGDNGTFTFTGTASSSFAISTVSGTGTAILSGLLAGSYTITENVQSGWTLTNNGCATVSVTAGATTTCTVLNTKLVATTSTSTVGLISGVKFEDKNGNGVRDAGDNGLIGWVIYIDANNNGRLNFGERSTVTNQNGEYRFSNLPAGTYTIREVGRPRWMQTMPTTGNYTVTLTQGQTSSGNNFGNFKKGIISAFLYDDKNGNGWFNRFEKGLRNWQAKLMLPNGTWITQSTDEDGYVTFEDLGPGTYSLREILKSGWFQTSANPAPITITSGKVVENNDFGNKKS